MSRSTVFLGAHVAPELRAHLEDWAEEEERSLSNLVTKLIRGSLIKSGHYPFPLDQSNTEPQRKQWPEITLQPPVKITLL